MTDRLRAIAEAAAIEWVTSPGSVRMASLMMQLRAALAEQDAEQEPIAWANVNKQGDITHTSNRRDSWAKTQLYTAPHRREWQSLTDEEVAKAIRPLCQNSASLGQLLSFSMDEYRAIEAALKEKNHD